MLNIGDAFEYQDYSGYTIQDCIESITENGVIGMNYNDFVSFADIL